LILISPRMAVPRMWKVFGLPGWVLGSAGPEVCSVTEPRMGLLSRWTIAF
jgi:hypothetical protein